MKPRVIHIQCHTAPFTKEHVYYGWAARTARYMHTYAKGYENECFYAVTSIKQEKIWKEDGITYHLFPAWTYDKGLESFFGIIFSPLMMRALKEIAKNKETVIHIQGERSLLVWQIISTVKNNPIFIQFHGYRTPDILLLFEKIFITPFERYFFKYVKHFFVCMRNRIPYLVDNCRIDPKKISLQNLGVDYDLFKPRDRIEARRKLGLPLKKTIFLFVGRFDRTKGVKEIIDAHLKIKEAYDTYLILIGWTKNNEYYDYAKKNADRIIEWIDNKKLAPYFNASDAYCMLCPPYKAKTSGMGVAPCEALACDIPILSSNLFEAPTNIQSKIGFLVTNQKELEEKMNYMVNNEKHFTNIRTLTEPYYSWRAIIQNILRKYNSP
ncbi:hypothetical protein A2866_04035 [Candidatus Roizmanbacteria bacterium RIFCSPHIGHO2_01_FULL_39_8]|uniref:Glycosyl transferase family 1 domain-containing protein n=3 Tax=Candidatus Roizmaniibacteriota TaxID=1752723 RepID=A0A1F7GP97_9BACT|nr:MAG: hypothetical protein A2866_04035 [Candidatus Roizmanbacteria bacterium RIFCSPHIGHO2_01_FULL_39_8]OGK26607.1 MAG: hypothetical protein A3C28_03825 [Candidatus Roizmanbacteria bacterium RIFCSPHIGHO2_02_FULL_39_9]OGK35171.1 MAG: hypothetical protein A3F60_02775 [Candidatus Roizmanbacteria bacterium RIFCSPHIGHO2_12_FULL_39_8]